MVFILVPSEKLFNKTLVSSGYQVSLWDAEKFWRWMVGMNAKQCECTNASELYVHFKMVKTINFVMYILP